MTMVVQAVSSILFSSLFSMCSVSSDMESWSHSFDKLCIFLQMTSGI